MRILALLEAASITGTAKAVLEFAREASGVQVEVAIFARGNRTVDNALTRALDAENIPFHFIREKGRFDTSVLPRLRELADRLNPQIVWSNSVKSHFLVHLSGIPRGRKWAAFHHGYTATDFKMRLYNQLDRISLPRADRVVTVCQPFALQLEKRGVPAGHIRIQHMPIRPFPINPDKVRRLRMEFRIDSQTRVVLCIGRLSREKGHAYLIKAFSSLQNENDAGSLALIVVGDGPELTRLQQLAAASLPGKSILFAGHRDDVNSFYGLADIFVLPSLTEGTPNVLLEAMAAKVPIIATNVGGVPELVTDGENALLGKRADVSALATAMDQLLSSSKLRSDLAAAADTVVLNHSPQHFYRGLLAIFQEVS